MIANRCLEGYSKLILKILDTYSGDATVEATRLINTDEKYLKAEEWFSSGMTEEEFIEAVRQMK